MFGGLTYTPRKAKNHAHCFKIPIRCSISDKNSITNYSWKWRATRNRQVFVKFLEIVFLRNEKTKTLSGTRIDRNCGQILVVKFCSVTEFQYETSICCLQIVEDKPSQKKKKKKWNKKITDGVADESRLGLRPQYGRSREHTSPRVIYDLKMTECKQKMKQSKQESWTHTKESGDKKQRPTWIMEWLSCSSLICTRKMKRADLHKDTISVTCPSSQFKWLEKRSGVK